MGQQWSPLASGYLACVVSFRSHSLLTDRKSIRCFLEGLVYLSVSGCCGLHTSVSCMKIIHSWSCSVPLQACCIFLSLSQFGSKVQIMSPTTMCIEAVVFGGSLRTGVFHDVWPVRRLTE